MNTQKRMKNGKTNSPDLNSPTLAEFFFGIDGELIEFESNIGPRQRLEILQEIHKNLDDRQINPEHYEGRIIFMSTFQRYRLDIGHSKVCPWNSEGQHQSPFQNPLGSHLTQTPGPR